jgi:hypothetical protein
MCDYQECVKCGMLTQAPCGPNVMCDACQDQGAAEAAYEEQLWGERWTLATEADGIDLRDLEDEVADDDGRYEIEAPW